MKDIVAVIFENEIHHSPLNSHSFYIQNTQCLPQAKMSFYYSTDYKAGSNYLNQVQLQMVLLGFSSSHVASQMYLL